jgi:hypothetical protein
VVTDDGRYLVIEIGAACRPARGYRLPRPDQAGFVFEVLVWGIDSRFEAIYAKGAWYVKTDYKSPKGRFSRPIPASCPMCGRHRARGAGCDR